MARISSDLLVETKHECPFECLYCGSQMSVSQWLGYKSLFEIVLKMLLACHCHSPFVSHVISPQD